MAAALFLAAIAPPAVADAVAHGGGCAAQLPDGATTITPDAAFTASDASSEALQRNGFPVHPGATNDAVYRAALAHSLHFICPVITASNETSVPQPEESATGTSTTVTSNNWAGFQHTTHYYNEAWAYWTVPSVSPATTGLNGYSVIWPGIGSGNGTGDELVQAGTKQYAYISGAHTYNFWYEIYPKQSLQNISNLSLNHGNSVYVDVWYRGTTAYFYVVNQTTGDYTNIQETFNGNTGFYAEWIVERPRVDGTLTQLAEWPGAIHFTGATSYDTSLGSTECVADESRDRDVMYAGSTRIAYPSNLSGCTFDVYRDN